MWHVQNVPTPKLPKMAVDRQEHCGNSTPGAPGVLRNTTSTYTGQVPSQQITKY